MSAWKKVVWHVACYYGYYCTLGPTHSHLAVENQTTSIGNYHFSRGHLAVD